MYASATIISYNIVGGTAAEWRVRQMVPRGWGGGVGWREGERVCVRPRTARAEAERIYNGTAARGPVDRFRRRPTESRRVKGESYRPRASDNLPSAFPSGDAPDAVHREIVVSEIGRPDRPRLFVL